MKIKKFREGKELKTINETMTLSCPICNALWLKEEEGYNVDDGSCKHLRFVWHTGASSDGPNFFGKWDKKSFIKQFLLELNRKSKEDGEGEIYTEIPNISDSDLVKEILEKISSPDIDDVWEHVFFDEYCSGGGNDASEFYGVKT